MAVDVLGVVMLSLMMFLGLASIGGVHVNFNICFGRSKEPSH